MTHILGRQDCVDSLRRDLTDLQGAVLEVFARTGPVRFPSWKFPDKLSCNLDLVALLEQYDFVEGEEEFNQHSHIVLLELVIDRLMLLLQSFNAHAELMLGGHRNSPHNRQTGPSVSIGLVVKRYWNNLAQLGSFCQQLQQGRPKVIQESSAERTVKQIKCSSKMKTRSPSATSLQSTKTNLSHRSPSSTSQLNFFEARIDTPSKAAHISRDTRTVSSQTVDSSLVPCDACTKVQSSLRQVSDSLVGLCQSQGLPSSLVCFLDAVDETVGLGRLSATDLAQWAEEQTRDLGRVGKHLSKMRATVQPLRESLVTLEAARDELRKQVQRLEEQLEREVAEHQVNVQELELRLKEAQSHRDEVVNRLKGDREELRSGIESLEERNSRLQTELNLQLENVRVLESIKEGLQQEVNTREVDQEAFRELEEKNRMLDAQFATNQVLLDKECAKYQSACRQQESMQLKQKALLEQVDILDQQCTELQKQLEESEEGKEELQKKLSHMSEEKDQLKAQLKEQKHQIAELQNEKQVLESRVAELQGSVLRLQEETQELVQRVRLLVAFPELSPAGNAPPQSTGDVLKDMEQQLQANCVRIRVLEQENTTLYSSLAKLKERAQLRELRVISPQQMGLHSLPKDNPGNPGTFQGHSSQRKVSNSRAQRQLGVGDGTSIGKNTEAVGAWDQESLNRLLMNPSSSSKTLHQQTLALPLPPEKDTPKAYPKMPHSTRTRTAGVQLKRK